jgi:hypothetical protein
MDPAGVLSNPPPEENDVDAIAPGDPFFVYWNAPGRDPGWKVEYRFASGPWFPRPLTVSATGELRYIEETFGVTGAGQRRYYRVTVLRDDGSGGGSVDDTGPEPPVWKGGIAGFTPVPTETATPTNTPPPTATSTPTATPTSTATATPTPTRTPSVTPSPTVTPTPTPLIYDVNGDGLVGDLDLLLVIWDKINDPTAERSNFDGEGEIDHRDIFLFSQWWEYRVEGQ